MGMGHMHMGLAMDKLATLRILLRQVTITFSDNFLSFTAMHARSFPICVDFAWCGRRIGRAADAGAPSDPES